MLDNNHLADALLQQLDTLGLNRKQHCPVEYFFFFPKPDGAELAAQELRSEGYPTKVSMLSQDPLGYVVARGRLLPAAGRLDKIRNRMEQLAAKFGGEYDGWGIQTRPRGNRLRRFN